MATKAAIVTGGAQGIGKAIARSLLKDDYKVAIFDINDEVGKQTADGFSSEFGSGSCVFFNCDVTNSKKIRDCYEEIEKSLGVVCVVVNNAAYFDESNWKKLCEVNLTAVIDVTYLAVEKMRKDKGGKGGSVVNIASGAGLGCFPLKTAYTASKCGVIGFSKSMAASLDLAAEDWGISVLTLCPFATEKSDSRTEGKRIHDSVSPAVPYQECLKYFSEATQNISRSSVTEVAEAFMKLLKDNKNGAVMKLWKKKGSPQTDQYVEQKWSEI